MNFFRPRPVLKRGRPVARQTFALRRLISLMLLAGACQSSHAAGDETDCALPDAASAPTLLQLDAIALQCLKSAPYFRTRGHLESSQNLPEGALVSFEKALLLEPGHAGTQLDYAQALIAAGDMPSARDLLRQLLARDDVPPQVRPDLQRQLQELDATAVVKAAPAVPDTSHYRTTVSQSFGYDTNLNNAFSSSSLVLTGPQGNIELEVDPESRPKAGRTAITGLQWIGLHAWNDSLWIAQADLRHRYTSSHDHRYAQGDLALTWLQAPGAPRQWILRAASSNVWRTGNPLYASRLASALHQWAGSLCRPVAGVEVESRRYAQSEIVNGGYTGLTLSAQCAPDIPGVDGASTGPGFGGFGFGLRMGIDRPSDALRAGGNQQAAELRTRWQGKLQQVSLQVDYIWQRQLDQDGYSPLLGNDAVRRLTRNSLRLEAGIPITLFNWGTPTLFGTAEVAHQRSNIVLFNVLQAAVTVGLRWRL